MKVVLCLILLWTLTASEPIRYDRHKVVRVIPRTKEHLAILKTIQQQYIGHDQVDFWTYPRGLGNPVDIHLSPDIFGHMFGAFTMYGLQPRVIISDVQLMMDRQRYVPKNPMLGSEALDYGVYHKLDEIEQWMKDLVTAYPDKVTEFTVGKSFEDRTITGLKISTGGNKPAFWMEGGIHAREWISPATVIYMTAQMLDNYDSMKEWVDLFDWYILPVFNVDGYVYTWTNDRMWRKTRSENGVCDGADPNRNWDDHWCEEGASDNPCSETFCGNSAFSEIEVRAVADYIKTIPNLMAFIDFHSYTQLWMTPWAYTATPPDDYTAQKQGADEAVAALTSVHGTQYITGSIATTIYPASGSSVDWVYGKAGVKYSYAVELRDLGEYGFLLPEDQIIPSGEETLKAVEQLAKYIANNP